MEQQNLQSQPDINRTIDGYDTLVKTDKEGGSSLDILISGAHCAACIQKIESALLSKPDIKTARLNFSTKRLHITWNGCKEDANQYALLVKNLGYGISPFIPGTQDEETKSYERFLLLCLGVAGFAMGNIMLISVGLWSSSTETMGEATRELMHWLSALIAVPAILFCGRPFFNSAWKALKNKQTNMDVPISIALFLASGMSIYETLHHGEHVYFDSAVMLMFFLLIGRYLDFRARNHARSSATNLLSTLTGFATVIGDNNKTRRILIRDLREDMHIRVMSGEKFPIDGEITEGQSTVDTSLVTGEGLPRNIHIGDMVYAGTLNLSAPITVKVAKAADNSLLSDIVRLMETAEQGQARYIRLADRAARLYTPIVHSMAAIAFLGWFFIGGLPLAQAVMIAVTVLIITCPCALGLAVPVVQVLASGQLFKNGILLKSGDALEKLAHVDVMMLDKTGTLTLGTPVLNNPSSYRNIDFQIAASLAAHSAHPLSKALLSAYKDQDKLLSLNNIKEVAGLGLRASYEGKTVKLGNRHWCGDKNAPPSEAPEIWLSYRNQEPVRFNFTDPLRSDCVDIIRKFKNENVRPIISSGDQENSVRNVANQCHIERYYSTQKPPEKFELMQQLKSEGHKILMVGDGLNDTPTLTGADVSIAPGTAIDMAQNAADIVFMGDKFEPVYTAFKTARATQRLIKQNFTLAIIYNLIAIPLALTGMVTPLIAAIAMSGSSLLVIGNSFRLKLLS